MVQTEAVRFTMYEEHPCLFFEREVDFRKNEAKRCLDQLTEYMRENSTAKCPPSFDGILCWPSASAGTTISRPCPPDFVLGYKSPENANATKDCLANGRWYTNHENTAWSNYTSCSSSPGDEEFITAIQNIKVAHLELLKKWIPMIKIVSQIGYATSFTSLVIAMVVFSLLRKLRNPRNRLHMHLFASFIMRAFMALLKNWLFVDGVGLAWDIIVVDGKKAFFKQHNNWVCKVITSLWQYFIAANYALILMEGLYLHNLVFLALCADTSTITVYALLGWGLPVVVVTVWIIVRVIMEDTLCWTTHNNSSLFLIIQIPTTISILFNFILFVNIVRVLLLKMKTSAQLEQRKKMRYGRWVKSTLVLVPLFGTHYMLYLGLSYSESSLVELVGLFCDQLFASFQGCFVAFLYCLLNGEVRTELRRAWKAQKSLREMDSLVLSHRKLTRSQQSRLDPNLQRVKRENILTSSTL